MTREPLAESTTAKIGAAECIALCPQHSETPTLEILKVSGGLIGLPVLMFAVWQYRMAQRWKRTEFAASLLRELNSDGDLVASCSILDYPKRTLVLHHRCGTDGKPTSLEHDRKGKLLEAMAVERPKDGFTEEQILYRDLFDHFFVYLSQIEHFCQQRLVKPTSVSPLSYWLEKLLLPRNDEASSVDVFGKFIRQYHPGVIQLGQRFARLELLSAEAKTRLNSW